MKTKFHIHILQFIHHHSEVFYDISSSSDETANESVKEPSDLLVPPGGCSNASQDVESSPVSTSANDNSPLPSSESAPTTPQASPSSVPADSGESHARRMGKLWTDAYSFPADVLWVDASCVCSNILRQQGSIST
jgi:hypothetical protein